jgi:REP element-mobilizing transposase RayT
MGFTRILGMRKPRIILKGATFHVSARTNHDHSYLKKPQTKALLRKTFRDTLFKYDFKWRKFRISPTHIEFVIRPADAKLLSVIMQYFLGVFAQRFNRKSGLWGHFWGDRFKSEILKRAAQDKRGGRQGKIFDSKYKKLPDSHEAEYRKLYFCTKLWSAGFT